MFSEKQLLDCMENLRIPAHFKDPKTRKSLLVNKSFISIFGLKSPEQMVGNTIQDLNFFQSPYDGAWAKKIKEMDDLVQTEKRAVNDMTTFLNSNGILVCETTEKFPLLSHHGNVLGIVTFGRELTHRLSHRLLYQFYKNICGKKIATQKTLFRLEIESYFFALPTEAELLVLIERATGKADKEIAKIHCVSSRATETHLINLRSKLKGDVLSSIVSLLRNPNYRIDTI